ncbi:hypothetical protein ERO13_D06G145332v2 [Gossypium hirsutum]|uniref:Uncharacterized protein n=1 Tax=Gossypium darwinii TaxID=34276 RepID=A0A5D2CAM5_GOSDA|nr:hypothetical protein ERO13_D06G145332v2 [Gossypium hirsutum]TYG65395.1 hypothetical protein ES288_D06G182100v1 [Gossypium darwinii]
MVAHKFTVDLNKPLVFQLLSSKYSISFSFLVRLN